MDRTHGARGLQLPPLLASVWLVYLGFIPLGLWLSHATSQRWTIDLVVMAFFIAMYVAMFNAGKPWRLAMIGLMFGLGAAFIPVNPGTVVYIIYGASFFGWVLDTPSTAYRSLAGYTTAFAVLAFAEHMLPVVWLQGIVFSLLIGFVQVRFGLEQRQTERLHLAYGEVERLTKIAERERIARDLHDVLGHTLSLIVLKSELASKLTASDPERAAVEIRDVERIARESLADVRKAVVGYRGAGVLAEIDHARDVFASAGIELECTAADLRMPANYEGVLALAIREAVTNIVRHAGARSVRLMLSCDRGECRFEIVDDGRGGKGEDGAGLRGMRERVEALGGELERTVDNGTRIVISLPLRTAF